MKKHTRENCIFCGQSERLVPYRLIGHRNIVRCSNCGLLFANEYDEDALSECYDTEYYSSETDPRIDDWVRQNERVWDGLEKTLTKNKPDIKDILDIGSGTGGFLLNFKQKHPQANIFAVEQSRFARNRLKQKIESIEFPVEDAEEISKIQHEFDAVTLLQTLEHVKDPLALCKNIFNLLKPGGILLATAPNLNSYQAFMNKDKSLCFGNQTHLQFFSGATLAGMLKKTGFRKIKKCLEFGGSNVKGFMQAPQWVLRSAGLSNELRFIAFK